MLILKVATTFVHEVRTNTNEYVYYRANLELNANLRLTDKRKIMIRMGDFYRLQRRKLIAKSIVADNNDPIRESALDADSLKQTDYGFRRPGGKRNDWWEKGIEEVWYYIRPYLSQRWFGAPFQKNNLEQQTQIRWGANWVLNNRAQTRREVP